MNQNSEIKLWASPLQGFTDALYRRLYAEYFGGIDVYTAPYVRLNRGEMKTADARELKPGQNKGLKLLPQVLAATAEDFLTVARYVASSGYDSLDWNLGCPYPMVTRRGLGAGLLPHPEQINAVLMAVTQQCGLKLSVKMRLGLSSEEETQAVLEVLNRYDLTHVAVHPRTARQLYKGRADQEAFARCLKISRHELIYNGDIHSLDAYDAWRNRFPDQSQLMLGRALLIRPELAGIIKGESPLPVPELAERLRSLHDGLLEGYANRLSGEQHLLRRILPFWAYFAEALPSMPKLMKAIKKARTRAAYEMAVNAVWLQAGKAG